MPRSAPPLCEKYVVKSREALGAGTVTRPYLDGRIDGVIEGYLAATRLDGSCGIFGYKKDSRQYNIQDSNVLYMYTCMDISYDRE